MEFNGAEYIRRRGFTLEFLDKGQIQGGTNILLKKMWEMEESCLRLDQLVSSGELIITRNRPS